MNNVGGGALCKNGVQDREGSRAQKEGLALAGRKSHLFLRFKERKDVHMFMFKLSGGTYFYLICSIFLESRQQDALHRVKGIQMIKNICQLASVGIKHRTKEINEKKKKTLYSCADPVETVEVHLQWINLHSCSIYPASFNGLCSPKIKKESNYSDPS